MGYYIDLAQISIDEYRDMLQSIHLIPSWMILKEEVDNLEVIKKRGIENLQELKMALKNKDQLQEFSKQSDLSEQYLSVLRRMVNGYHRTPNKIKDFPETSEDVILKLEKMGIKNTFHFFDEIITPEKRVQLSQKTGIKEKDIDRLTQLTDLSRIRWVNHTFAYVLYETGYNTLKKVAAANPDQLYKTVKELNDKRKFYPAHIGLNDMKMLVESAKMLSLDIEY